MKVLEIESTGVSHLETNNRILVILLSTHYQTDCRFCFLFFRALFDAQIEIKTMIGSIHSFISFMYVYVLRTGDFNKRLCTTLRNTLKNRLDNTTFPTVFMLVSLYDNEFVFE